MVQTCLVCDGKTGVTSSCIAGVSTINATECESLRIQSICSADDVSKIGTTTPPANQVAKSKIVHS